MLRIAMNPPIMPASTAIQSARLALSGERAIARGTAAAASATGGTVGSPGSRRMRPIRLARARRDGRIDRHAGAKLAEQRAAGIEHDLHRDALDDLGEVAGGIVGRQQ